MTTKKLTTAEKLRALADFIDSADGFPEPTYINLAYGEEISYVFIDSDKPSDALAAFKFFSENGKAYQHLERAGHASFNATFGGFSVRGQYSVPLVPLVTKAAQNRALTFLSEVTK